MSTVDTEADRQRSILEPDVEQARYDRGAQALSAVDGEGGQSVVDAVDAVDAVAHIAPAGRRRPTYGFGEVYARPGLTLPQWQLATIDMLTALGGCEPS